MLCYSYMLYTKFYSAVFIEIKFFLLDGKSSTIVNVNIYLRSINDIDDYKMVSNLRK